MWKNGRNCDFVDASATANRSFLNYKWTAILLLNFSERKEAIKTAKWRPPNGMYESDFSTQHLLPRFSLFTTFAFRRFRFLLLIWVFFLFHFRKLMVFLVEKRL
ncbi:hypothetical protein CEXT_453791 [Caerostris extrusa]|uniref:Uncharacterized protein n=1 Tax=Caerostris extrusa TaxID=172846 RepID=A0AAV4XCX6_CAEEX|nr:hypothetical protein CEXT_453791 [Caerostris extrusa]